MLYEYEKFYKVIVIRIGLLGSQIIDEIHKGTYQEAVKVKFSLENDYTKCLIVHM